MPTLPPIHRSLPLKSTRLRLALTLLASLFAIGTSNAQITLQLDQSVDRSTATTDGEVFEILIGYSCVSTLEAANGATMTTEFNTELDVVSITGSAHTVLEEPSATGKKVFFTFVDPLPAGATGQLRIQAKFKAGTADGDLIDIRTTMDASNASQADTGKITISAVGASNWQPISSSPGASIYKWANAPTIALPAEPGAFYITHGNTGAAGEDISNYVVEDVLPDGMALVYLATGAFSGTSVPMKLAYRTNLNAQWIGWESWDDATAYSRYIYPDSLQLPQGEYVTGVQLHFGTIPGGGAFHPDNPGNEPITIRLQAAPDHPFIGGETIENTARLTGTGSGGAIDLDGWPTVNESSSATMVVGAAAADYDFFDWDSTQSAPYAVGDVIRMRIGIVSTNRNGVTMEDPNFAWLMPAEMDYLGNESFEGAGWVKMGTPAPLIETLPNFGGTGRTLIRFSWNGHQLAPSGEYDHILSEFDVRFNGSAVNGTTVESELYGGWQQPQGEGWHWNVIDELDYDGDGDTSEWIAKDVESFEINVDPGSGTASLDAVLWVKGAVDMNWSRYPNVGHTNPGGSADYELRLTNKGGVALKDISIVDILPHVGDGGVVQHEVGRDSKWAPLLAGSVNAPPGVDVYYSTSTNPERTDLVPTGPAGSEDPAWTKTIPTDITTVKSIKFQFDTKWLAPGEEVVLSWPMRAPSNAPTDGSVAWNSFGFVATRADDGVRLLPSEPVKVGIALQPAGGAYYGDWVWEDANRNGLIDPDEVGVSGVRIELYRDNGDYIADPDTDEFVTFTVTSNDGESDGKFLFAGLDAGRYFTVVYLNDGYTSSLPPGGPGFGLSTNVLEHTPDDGGFENGLGDWWALPKMKVVPTGGAGDGGAHAEVYKRNKSIHGVDLRIENLLEENKLYTFEVYAKVRDVREDIQIKLLTNGFDVVSEINATVEPGFAESDPWTKVSGALQTFTANFTLPHTLSITTAATTQDFKIDQVSIQEFDLGLDSDGERSYVSGMPVAVLPVTDLASGEQQLNWDQGIHTINGGQPSVWAAADQGNGKLLIGGEFTASHGVPRRNIARLLENGDVDLSFDPGSGTNLPVRAFASLDGGCVVAGGRFTEYAGVPVNGLVCIADDGSYVGGIAQPNKADIRWMAVDGEGRLLVAGGFSSIGGENRRSIARLNADGTIDSSFRSISIDGPINGGAILSDGCIAIVGEFKKCGGEKMGGVAILSENGVVDEEFEPDPGADGPIYSVSQKAGGRLVLAGDFESFNETKANGTVRIDREGEVDSDHGRSQLDISTVRQSY